MAKSQIVLVTVLASLLGAGLMAFSASSHDGAPARPIQEEALLGTYRCGAGPSQGFLTLELDATGDILDGRTNVFRTVPVPSTPAEVCEFHSSAALESLASAPCAISAVEVSSDETGESRLFQFVCHTGREAIVRTIADVSRALLTGSP